MIRIVIAEDHQLLIDGLKLLLVNLEWIEVVGQANDGDELIRIVDKVIPDVVLTDIRMPKVDGIEATKIIKKSHPQCAIIGFSMFEQEEIKQKMKKAGASGYLVKNASLDELTLAIKTVADGGKYFKDLKDENLNNTINNTLSTREKEIFNLIGKGKTSKEIADILFISEMTVSTHRKNICRKLNLEGRTDLIRYAYDNKIEFEL